MSGNASPKSKTAPRMLIRSIHDHVQLLRDGRMEAAIVSPAEQPWLAAAEELADQLERLTGSKTEILDARVVFDRHQLSVGTTFQNRPLIFIGHAGVNPALLALYVRRIFIVDDTVPGSATVQTFGNPWGNGQGAVLVGASCPDQITTAVDLFLEQCQIHLHNDSLSLPRLHIPGDDPLAQAASRQYWRRLLDEHAEPWCKSLRDAPVAHLGYEEARQLHEFTVITDLGVFNEQQVNTLEQAMLDAVLQMPAKVWWYPGPNPRNGRVGGRHENFKSPRLLMLVRHLLEVGRPDDEARHRLEQIRQPLEQYLEDVLTSAYRNDHEGSEATTGWEAMVWAALATGKSCYFTSGRAQEAAFNAFLETDNLGASASHCQFGGVGNLFQASELRLILTATAWWHEDGRYRWLLENLPYVTHHSYSYPLRLGLGDLPATKPDAWLGMHWQPVSKYSYESSLINSRWRQPVIPRERTADVLAFRSGFGIGDQYLALDGFQNHFQPLGLGAILRYGELGKLFLVAHTGAEGNYYKSGLAVSRGVVDGKSENRSDSQSDNVSEPWGAEITTAVDKGEVSLAAMRCADYHGVDWTRHVIWSKGRYFLFIDHVVTRGPGMFALTATWRTGFPAEMDGDNWLQRQGDVTFHLKAAQSLASHAGREPEHLYQNEIVPYILRQHAFLNATHAGEHKTIANLVYASSPDRPATCETSSLTEQVTIIHGNDHLAMAGFGGYEDESIRLRSPMFHVSSESAVLAGPAELWLDGHNILEGNQAGDIEMTWTDAQAGEIRTLLQRLWSKATSLRATQAAHQTTADRQTPLLTWEADPFDASRQKIEAAVQKDETSPDGNRWTADLGSEFDLHEVIVECEAEKLVGGDHWPEFNTEPAHPEPVTLKQSVAQATQLTMTDEVGREKVTRGTLIEQYIGPYGKSSFAIQPGIRLAGARARRLEIDMPAGTSLKHVSIHGEAMVPAQIVDLQVSDPHTADGRSNLLCRSMDDQLALISPKGQLLWRRRFERKILAATALKLNVAGESEIVVSDAGANLWRLSQDGRVLECTKLSTADDARGDFFNQGHTQNRPYALGTWRPAGEREPALFMGTYQSLAWRSAGGAITCWPRTAGGQDGRTGIAWRGLIYWDRVLRDATDLDGDGVDDQVVFGRGFATSPAVTFISGRTHEVFAQHPFPNGWSLGLEHTTLAQRQVIVAVNEFQLGIFTPAGKVIRTLRFDTPAAGYALDGEDLYVAKCDGMLLRFDANVRLVSRTTLPGPLRSIAAGQTIAVAAQNELHLLSRELQLRDRLPLQCSKLLRLGQGRVAAATTAGHVVMLPIT